MDNNDLHKLLGRGVAIGGPPQLVLKEQRIICPGAIDLQPGGLAQKDCDMHLCVYDLANGVCWRVPHNVKFMREFAGQILKVCAEIDGVDATREV